MIFYMIFSFFGFSQAECLSEHLKSAYELNQLRKPLYSALTNGASEKISNFLISEEKNGYWPARLTEWSLRRHHAAGIPILCEDFISMSEVSDFTYDDARTPLKEVFEPVDSEAIQDRLLNSFRSRNFIGLGNQVERELQAFESSSYNCMVKHILESIGRTAFLSEKYIKASQELGLSSPSFRLWTTLRIKIYSIGKVEKIDRWAAPIQKSGVPIVCNDVPHIPLHSEWSL